MIQNVRLPDSYGFTLKRMAEGGRIDGNRLYPFEFIYRLFRKDGHRYANPITPECVSALLRYRLIEPVSQPPKGLDHTSDSMRYRITDLGRKAAENQGTHSYDDGQLDLLEGAA